MKRTFRYSAVLGIGTVLLSACQTTSTVVDTVRIKRAETKTIRANASIYCAGVKHCEFERINTIPIMDATTHRVSSESLKRGIVRLQGSVFSQHNAVYLSVPSNQYELVIRFYPISPDRAETFHVIHQFKPHHRYTFKMYRERSKHAGGSLLNVSAPEPLCVALLEDNQHVIRRFCRPYDVVTGLGEFLEQKV